MATDTKLRTHIRWMILRDRQEVLEIERLCFQFPWSESGFVSRLKNRNCIGMVAVDAWGHTTAPVDGYTPSDLVYGYMVYDLHKDRIELLNLAVGPRYQGRGVGREMLDKLKAKLSPERRRRICADVGERNLEAQLFFRSQGFEAVAVIDCPWDDDDQDAYRMVYRL